MATEQQRYRDRLDWTPLAVAALAAVCLLLGIWLLILLTLIFGIGTPSNEPPPDLQHASRGMHLLPVIQPIPSTTPTPLLPFPR